LKTYIEKSTATLFTENPYLILPNENYPLIKNVNTKSEAFDQGEPEFS